MDTDDQTQAMEILPTTEPEPWPETTPDAWLDTALMTLYDDVTYCDED